MRAWEEGETVVPSMVSVGDSAEGGLGADEEEFGFVTVEFEEILCSQAFIADRQESV